MVKYQMQGGYHFRGDECEQSGDFEVDESGNISGLIIDPNSTHPRREVSGKISHSDSRTVLDFVKSSRGTLYLDIFYHLEKSGKEIEGRYDGFWSVRGEAIRLGIGYKPGVGEAVMVIPVTEKENRAYLTLTKTRVNES